jgi:hypothetical protein
MAKKKEKLIHCNRRKIVILLSFQQDTDVYASKHLKI